MASEETIIKEFADKMLDKINLRHNRYQPLGWMTMDTKRILHLLKEEIKEYEESKSPDEAIDVANYAMFLWRLSIENNLDSEVTSVPSKNTQTINSNKSHLI